MTSPVTCTTSGIQESLKCCIKTLLHLDFPLEQMLFGSLQPLPTRERDIWLRTILIVRKETRCRHIGYSYRLTARVLLYAPSHRQDNTYHTAFVTPVVEHWLEREIAQWVLPMKDRSDDTSHHERTLYL